MTRSPVPLSLSLRPAARDRHRASLDAKKRNKSGRGFRQRARRQKATRCFRSPAAHHESPLTPPKIVCRAGRAGRRAAEGLEQSRVGQDARSTGGAAAASSAIYIIYRAVPFTCSRLFPERGGLHPDCSSLFARSLPAQFGVPLPGARPSERVHLRTPRFSRVRVSISMSSLRIIGVTKRGLCRAFSFVRRPRLFTKFSASYCAAPVLMCLTNRHVAQFVSVRDEDDGGNRRVTARAGVFFSRSPTFPSAQIQIGSTSGESRTGVVIPAAHGPYRHRHRSRR